MSKKGKNSKTETKSSESGDGGRPSVAPAPTLRHNWPVDDEQTARPSPIRPPVATEVSLGVDISAKGKSPSVNVNDALPRAATREVAADASRKPKKSSERDSSDVSLAKPRREWPENVQQTVRSHPPAPVAKAKPRSTPGNYIPPPSHTIEEVGNIMSIHPKPIVPPVKLTQRPYVKRYQTHAPADVEARTGVTPKLKEVDRSQHRDAASKQLIRDRTQEDEIMPSPPDVTAEHHEPAPQQASGSSVRSDTLAVGKVRRKKMPSIASESSDLFSAVAHDVFAQRAASAPTDVAPADDDAENELNALALNMVAPGTMADEGSQAAFKKQTKLPLHFMYMWFTAALQYSQRVFEVSKCVPFPPSIQQWNSAHFAVWLAGCGYPIRFTRVRAAPAALIGEAGPTHEYMRKRLTEVALEAVQSEVDEVTLAERIAMAIECDAKRRACPAATFVDSEHGAKLPVPLENENAPFFLDPSTDQNLAHQLNASCARTVERLVVVCGPVKSGKTFIVRKVVPALLHAHQPGVKFLFFWYDCNAIMSLSPDPRLACVLTATCKQFKGFGFDTSDMGFDSNNVREVAQIFPLIFREIERKCAAAKCVPVHIWDECQALFDGTAQFAIEALRTTIFGEEVKSSAGRFILTGSLSHIILRGVYEMKNNGVHPFANAMKVCILSIDRATVEAAADHVLTQLHKVAGTCTVADIRETNYFKNNAKNWSITPAIATVIKRGLRQSETLDKVVKLELTKIEKMWTQEAGKALDMMSMDERRILYGVASGQLRINALYSNNSWLEEYARIITGPDKKMAPEYVAVILKCVNANGTLDRNEVPGLIRPRLEKCIAVLDALKVAYTDRSEIRPTVQAAVFKLMKDHLLGKQADGISLANIRLSKNTVPWAKEFWRVVQPYNNKPDKNGKERWRVTLMKRIIDAPETCTFVDLGNCVIGLLRNVNCHQQEEVERFYTPLKKLLGWGFLDFLEGLTELGNRVVERQIELVVRSLSGTGIIIADPPSLKPTDEHLRGADSAKQRYKSPKANPGRDVSEELVFQPRPSAAPRPPPRSGSGPSPVSGRDGAVRERKRKRDHESEDEDERQAKKPAPSSFIKQVFVGNVSVHTSEATLIAVFSQVGPVVNGVIRGERKAKFAFITYTTATDAQAAVDRFNQTNIDGRRVRVELVNK